MDVEDAVLCILHLELCCSENSSQIFGMQVLGVEKTSTSVNKYETNIEKLSMKENLD